VDQKTKKAPVKAKVLSVILCQTRWEKHCCIV